MKTKFYLLTIFVFLALALSAQKYNVMLVEEWKNNSWTNSLKTTNTYDSNGKLVKLTTQGWNAPTSLWDNTVLISYTLNSDGTIKESSTQAWVADNKSWEDVNKTIYTYSASKKIVTATTQLWVDGSGIDFSKNSYTYNDIDSLSTLITQTINLLTMQFVNSTQSTYTYYSDGTENQSVVQTWTMDQWVNSQRTTHTYNASKHLTLSLNEKWENDAWINDTRDSYSYNASGSINESVEESWLANAWVNSSKQIFSYKTGGQIEQIVSQSWNTVLALWENELRITYDLNATGINPVKLTGKASAVFPNPFEDQLTIESGTLDEQGVEIYNSVGQLINSFKTNELVKTLNLGGLKKGVYFMKIKSPQNEQTIKLLKAR